MEKVKVNMLNDVFFKALLCDDRHKELTLNLICTQNIGHIN